LEDDGDFEPNSTISDKSFAQNDLRLVAVCVTSYMAVFSFMTGGDSAANAAQGHGTATAVGKLFRVPVWLETTLQVAQERRFANDAMAPPSQLFARVFQWLANEVIVKGLANNRAFQQFAVRSSQQAREASKAAADAAKALAGSPNVAQIRSETDEMRKRAYGFASALREELSRAAADAAEQLGTGQRKPPPTPPRGR
jgi:hypothetical protein